MVVPIFAWYFYCFSTALFACFDIGFTIALLQFQGEFLSATSPKEAPFSPTPLPPESESDKMAYLWMTDYVVNTAGLVFQQAGALNETITPSMVRETKLLKSDFQ